MDQVIINKNTVQNLEDAKKIFKEGLQVSDYKHTRLNYKYKYINKIILF